MIRVLHVAESTTGGVPHFVRRLCEGLGADFESGIVCPAESDLALKPPRHTAIHKVPISHGVHPLRDLRSAMKVRSIVSNGKYDIVHYNSTKAGVLGLLLRFSLPASTVFTPHGLRSHAYKGGHKQRAARFAEARICGSVDIVGAISEDEGERVGKRKNLRVIENGVDLLALSASPKISRRNLGIPDDAYLVGMVARLSAQKDPLTFVRAARRVLDEVPNAHFAITGDGELTEQARSLANDLGLAGRFHLLGWRNDAVEIMKLFDVFVSTSLYEGMAFSLLEAAGARKPIVATEVPGIDSLVDHYVSGILVRPGDHERVADALIALHRDTGFRANLAEGAYERIAGPRTLDVMLASWRGLYNSLLAPETAEPVVETALRPSGAIPDTQQAESTTRI